MTLPAFEIHCPATLAEAGGLMERLGDDAVVYAGGTELLLVMKLGFADPGHLIDVKGVADLARLEADGDDLVIGGGVTHREIERSPLVRERWPALAAMAARRRERARPRGRHAGREPGVRRPALGSGDVPAGRGCADRRLVRRGDAGGAAWTTS